MRYVACLVAVSLVAGCSSVPQRSAEGTASGGGARKGGGYYLNDGPGEDVPANLDQIPDAVPRAEPLSRFANKPYTVFDTQYVPDRSARPFRQRGIASWYGKRFHGQRTSSGEPYDMYAMTAAHPTLPIPSYARVTNLANGRSVVVRVNDRGPFLHQRIMDLSYAAAYKLGYADQGSAMVEVESVLPGVPVTPPATTAVAAAPAPEVQSAGATVPIAVEAGGIYLQLGAFSTRDNAESFRDRIAGQLMFVQRPLEIYLQENLYRVHVGPYRDRAEALSVAGQIRAVLDLAPHVVVR